MSMTFYKLEHSRVSYFADFAVYLVVIVSASGFLLLVGPPSQRLSITISITGGQIGWTFLEYVLHRFVLHGPEPFRGWHLDHHKRPRALIGTPTVFSAALIAGLVFLPMLMLGGLWMAIGFTLGIAIGYLNYVWTHHAIHHWPVDAAWLKDCKRFHALHHGSRKRCHYGVTTVLWDRVFFSRSARKCSDKIPGSSTAPRQQMPGRLQ